MKFYIHSSYYFAFFSLFSKSKLSKYNKTYLSVFIKNSNYNKYRILNKIMIQKFIKRLIAVNSFSLLISVIFHTNTHSTDQIENLYICADEIGPLIEFSIPEFKENSSEESFDLKYHESDNRKKFLLSKGKITKKSSPIDYSYVFYEAQVQTKIPELKNIQFEFFPPSHMMIKRGTSPFSSLVCWKN